MATARSIIAAAHRKIGVGTDGEVLSAADAANGLEALNQMLDSWSVEGNLVFYQQEESFPLTINVSEYTIGSGADFDTVRPVSIEAAFVRNDGNYDYTLEKNDVRDWADINYKDTGGVPQYFYYDYNFPVAKIHLFPRPASSYNLHIFSSKRLSSFANLSDVVSLPEGYEQALVYNLALHLAPEFQIEPSPTVKSMAANSLSRIQGRNSDNKNYRMGSDPALLQGDGFFNINSRT